MKRVISCVLLMLVLTSNAFALEVPTGTVVQNLNGSQQAIKTFTVSPEQDPAALIEEPFELEGYLYTFADIVKSENPVEEKRIHTEVITVETTKDDLALILEQLKPTIEYDDGRFQGTLALDHTSLNTVAAGYATKNYTVTETKTIGQLDRNDMSYVPATTIKNGRTLSLANVEWQVTGTDLVGEALMPSQYQAVATYSAKASYQAATGYVTTAEYIGDVTHEGVESVTYVLTYIGTEANHKGVSAAQVGAFFADHFPWILGGIVLICAAVGGTLLVCRRKAVVKAECERMKQRKTKKIRRRKNMKLFQKLVCMALTATATASLSICAFAADYTFDTAADTDYYPSTSYEDTYGTAYHYGSKNLVDYQIPELPYGVLSTTQTGVMEKLRLPGLQQTVGGSASGIYGVDSGVGIPAVTPVISSYQEPAYTSAKDMERKDGSIGTLKIPSLDINMKVWEGETKESMKKGLGHYSSTSAWDGNIGVCGHNRGAKYTIGSIEDLEIGDTITYTTIYGTRTYEVVLVKTISNSDWSYLQATADNRITLTTCLANQPEKRICVQAVQITQ